MDRLVQGFNPESLARSRRRTTIALIRDSKRSMPAADAGDRSTPRPALALTGFTLCRFQPGRGVHLGGRLERDCGSGDEFRRHLRRLVRRIRSQWPITWLLRHLHVEREDVF
jgi:hypothetical protein